MRLTERSSLDPFNHIGAQRVPGTPLRPTPPRGRG